MLDKLMRKVYVWRLVRRESLGRTEASPPQALSTSLRVNLKCLKDLLDQSDDIVFREFLIGSEPEQRAAIIYVEGLVDKQLLNNDVLESLMFGTREVDGLSGTPSQILERIERAFITIGHIRRANTLEVVIDSFLTGETALLVDGCDEALIISTRGWSTRAVEKPETEVVVRGPREGFTETLRTNTVLLRRRLRTPNLVIETMKIGRHTRTDVSIAYIRGIVNPSLVEEVKRRLSRIEIDAVLESGYIEEFIEDAPFSPFSTVSNTERPDVVAAKMLEGRVAILVDNTPFVLLVPMVFIESFQIPEDYYSRPWLSTLIRWLRFIGFAVSALGPATYVALTTFHQELVPTPLLLTMAGAREGTPFPAVVEALAMGLVFELLREAGVRLPRQVGQAVSIVGALVIGEAAVSAGLIGSPMVIVVAVTAIASFVVPPQIDVGVLLRLFTTVLAGVLGAFGITIGILAVLVHLASLRSFGTPYLSPFAPTSLGDLKDTVIRAPLWAMFARPRTIGWRDPQRQEYGQIPTPASDQPDDTEK